MTARTHAIASCICTVVSLLSGITGLIALLAYDNRHAIIAACAGITLIAASLGHYFHERCVRLERAEAVSRSFAEWGRKS